MGLSPDDVLGPAPELSIAAEQAVHCWNFCEGWAPERWPVYAALHDVADWQQLAELMLAMRNHMGQK